LLGCKAREKLASSVLREAFQDLNRVRQIAQIAARHGFADVLERSGVWRLLGRKETVEISAEAQRASTAKRFCALLNDLGPTFVKLGQILSTRADLLPSEYIDELSTLQDHVPPFPVEQLRAEIERSFGKRVDELFRSIDATPLAAASIAQVHRAETLEGERVVVKVQRPGISQQIRADLSVLHYLARLLEAVVEETGLYTPTGIVEEFDRAIHEELDFEREANNVEAFVATHRDRPFVRIPKVYRALSNSTVLTLELLDGVKISQVDLAQHDRQKLARQLIETSFRMLFQDGLFHADPHPGNILVLAGDVLGLLDFGLVGRLTKAMQQTIITLCVAVALKDSDSVARLLYRVGTPDARANLMAFRDDIEQIIGRYLPGTLGEVKVKNLVSDLFDLSVKYRIRIPKEYALLARAGISVEGIIRTLYPDLVISQLALPYARELLTGGLEPGQLQGGLMKTLFRIQGLANELPVQLTQILLDLEAGKFTTNVRSDQLERMNASIRGLGLVAILGFCACGFIVGGFLSFAQTPWVVRGVPVLGVLGLVAAAGLFGAAFSWYAFGGLRKLSLRRMLRGTKR
jgi:ubiquinone biosynthesis protein